jgi:hypothetical protein
MWLRTAELTLTPDAVRLRHETVSGPECRLRAALLRCNGAPGGAAGPQVAGAAWESPDGDTYWGWPDGAGSVRLWPASARPDVCVMLPTALALALALRRSGTEPGARALVIGEGFLARVARAVASAAGCRVEAADAASGPDVVIETTGESQNLDRAAALCRPWGRIYSLGGGLASGPFDYYPQVHSRALTLARVPDHPVLLAGEAEIVERGAARLTDALGGIAPAAEETLEALVLPAGARARVARERSGWSLLLVEDDAMTE